MWVWKRELEFTILSFIDIDIGIQGGRTETRVRLPRRKATTGRTSLPDGNLEILLFAPFVPLSALSEALGRLEGVGGIKEGVHRSSSSLVVTWAQGRGNKIEAHRGGRAEGQKESVEGGRGRGRFLGGAASSFF